MVKLVLKHYKRKTASVNHICDFCNLAIKKYYEYMKNDHDNHRLHIHCFKKLNLDAIEQNIKNIKSD